MKRIFTLLFALCVFTIAEESYSTDTVAVLNFKSIMTQPEMGVAVAEILRTELVRFGEYTIVERGRLDQILKEQAFQHTGAVDTETAVTIGNMVGADFVITGSIIKTGNIYIINSRLINAESGVIKDGDIIQVDNEESISNRIQQLALNIKSMTSVPQPIIFSFEPAQSLGWQPNYEKKGIRLKRSKNHLTHESYSLQADFPKIDYPGIYSSDFPINWSNYSHLSADVYLEKINDNPLLLVVRIDDQSSRSYENRFHWDMSLQPGTNRVYIQVKTIQTSIDVKQIRAVYFFLQEPKKRTTLYFDNIRLE
ncbi:CsgG/HfaB family protein [Thermodesulfobacteriota bacterium]